MRQSCRWILGLAALFFALAASRSAQAQPMPKRAAPTSAVVLWLDSEDAEDQAEALTGALRSRVRTAPHWALTDTPTSLGLFTAALKCTAKPDAACSAKIADQLKTDNFFWGVMSKMPPNQVAAEIHLWSRGKPEQMTTEVFSDNLRDQNDDQLRRLAGRIFEKLVGATTSGELSVRVGEVDGTLLIDGMPQALIEHGHATIEIKPGAHVLEVRSEGYAPYRQSVVIKPGAEMDFDVHLERAAPAPPEDTPSKPLPTRLIVELSVIGVGVGLAVAGTVEAAHFLSLQSRNSADHTLLRADNFCDKTAFHTATDMQMDEACGRIHDAKNARTVELVLYAAGAVVAGTGLAFLLSDPARHGEKTTRRDDRHGLRMRLAPRLAPTSGGLDVVGTF